MDGIFRHLHLPLPPGPILPFSVILLTQGKEGLCMCVCLGVSAWVCVCVYVTACASVCELMPQHLRGCVRLGCSLNRPRVSLGTRQSAKSS
jgi:hypothetical protein